MNEQNSNISIHNIAIEDIYVNPFQPRKNFNLDNLSSLAESIKKMGVMQPIVITKKDNGKFELIAGERRLRASKLAEKKTIPAVLREKKHSDLEKFELAIIENVQREDLNPVDKAESFKRLAEEFGLTHSEIASKVGKSREYISNSLRILLLPDNMLDAMVDGKISEGHAKPLLMLKERPLEQNQLFEKIVKDKLTVRSAKKIANLFASDKLRKPEKKEDVELKNIEQNLAEKLGTKVSIDKKINGDGGKLTIEYFSKEDLIKIMDIVRGKGLSKSPTLDIEKNYGMESFQENFKDEDENILENSEPQFFEEEIKNLEENIEENKNEDFGGFNITSFDENNFLEKKEEILEENIAEKEPENFDNFAVEKKPEIMEEKVEENFDNFAMEKEPKILEENLEEKPEENFDNFYVEKKPEIREEIFEEKIEQKTEENFVEKIEDKIEEKVSEKSEEQKRIDNILAGISTVDENYNLQKDLSKNTNLNQTEDLENKKEIQGEDIEKKDIYQNFLDSKNQIVEDNTKIFMDEDFSGIEKKPEEILDKKEEIIEPLEIVENTENPEKNQEFSSAEISENLKDLASYDQKNNFSDIDQEKFFPDLEKNNFQNFEKEIEVEENPEEKKDDTIYQVFSGDDFVPKKNEEKKGDREDHGFSI